MPEWELEIRKHLAGLNLRPEREAEIIEELSDHLQQRYEELGAEGAGQVLAEIDWRNLVPECRPLRGPRSAVRWPRGQLRAGTCFRILRKTCTLHCACCARARASRPLRC